MFVIILIINFPFQLGFGINPQAMFVFEILFSISIVNCYFRLGFQCPIKDVSSVIFEIISILNCLFQL